MTYVLECLLLLLEVVRGRVEVGLRLPQLVLELLHLFLQLLHLLLRLLWRFRGQRIEDRGLEDRGLKDIGLEDFRRISLRFHCVLGQCWIEVAFSLRFTAMLSRFCCVSEQCCRVFVAFRGNFGKAIRMMKERKRKGRGLDWSFGGDSRSGGPSPSPRASGWRS